MSIERLAEFREKLRQYDRAPSTETRQWLNQNAKWVRRQVVEAGCLSTVTIGPPPAVGGLVMRDIDPFSMMFERPYGISLTSTIVDMIDKAIGVLDDPGPKPDTSPKITSIQLGYAFVAMAINPKDPTLGDVLDSVKEACARCGVEAERVDEQESNDRITDRIMESIQKAEFVIVDLTNERPNVFFEAGVRSRLR